MTTPHIPNGLTGQRLLQLEPCSLQQTSNFQCLQGFHVLFLRCLSAPLVLSSLEGFLQLIMLSLEILMADGIGRDMKRPYFRTWPKPQRRNNGQQDKHQHHTALKTNSLIIIVPKMGPQNISGFSL